MTDLADLLNRREQLRQQHCAARAEAHWLIGENSAAKAAWLDGIRLMIEHLLRLPDDVREELPDSVADSITGHPEIVAAYVAFRKIIAHDPAILTAESQVDRLADRIIRLDDQIIAAHTPA